MKLFNLIVLTTLVAFQTPAEADAGNFGFRSRFDSGCRDVSRSRFFSESYSSGVLEDRARQQALEDAYYRDELRRRAFLDSRRNSFNRRLFFNRRGFNNRRFFNRRRGLRSGFRLGFDLGY